jgi:tRNA modification GTPase
MNLSANTIYALATPHGKAGVAIIRISGANAFQALQHLGVKEIPVVKMATITALTHQQETLDTALVLRFEAPRSFTGEHVVELHLHGGKAVIRTVLDALSTCPGLRLAQPGEFSRRAFANGKMDLTQAEGLADLIDAETTAQHRQAIRLLGGDANKRITELREHIIAPLALLEAYIDFPDEEIPDEVLSETTARIADLKAEVSALLQDDSIGEKIRDGVEIVILGPPNAGKSSLLNCLARRDVAIVSNEPGTTRDMIELHLELGGYEVTLIDTAGLRETGSGIELEGIRRAKVRAEKADFTLLLLDCRTAGQEYMQFAHLLTENSLLLLTKSDISSPPTLPYAATGISTITGDGVEALIERLRAMVVAKMGSVPAPLITRARHRESLGACLAALTQFSPDQPLELACEELRAAATQLGKITGKIWVDDVLDLVFSRFCIGK